MFADRGIPTLAVDLDPQANLTSMFLEDDRLEDLWKDHSKGTIFGCIEPLMRRVGDIGRPHVEKVDDKLGLVAGDLALSRFEDLLSESWPHALDGQEAAFRILSSFNRIMLSAAEEMAAELILIDVGPNLGAINRTALLAARQVIIPLAPDLFSLQGLRNLGPTLREWRKGWSKRLGEVPEDLRIALPTGEMTPAGYVIMQHGIRDSRPVKAYERWMSKIPAEYRNSVLDQHDTGSPSVDVDPFNLALLKHYRSLMPLAMEAHKPMFFLKSADGAIGAHAEAVKSCYADFLRLARRINEGLGLYLK